MAIGQPENKCPLHAPTQTSGEETLEDRSRIMDDVEILLRPRLGVQQTRAGPRQDLFLPGSCVQPLAPWALLPAQADDSLQKTTLCGYTYRERGPPGNSLGQVSP